MLRFCPKCNWKTVLESLEPQFSIKHKSPNFENNLDTLIWVRSDVQKLPAGDWVQTLNLNLNQYKMLKIVEIEIIWSMLYKLESDQKLQTPNLIGLLKWPFEITGSSPVYTDADPFFDF